jgi:plastocyanin
MRALALGTAILCACGGDRDPALPDAAFDAAPVDAPADASDLVNGCTPAMAVDLTDPGASRSIQISDDFYTPRCLRIAVGQSVTWNGDLDRHPLAPGILRPSMVEVQPGSPIPMVSTGLSAMATFPDAGLWAFYCPLHPPGMAGVVYVDP